MLFSVAFGLFPFVLDQYFEHDLDGCIVSHDRKDTTLSLV